MPRELVYQFKEAMKTLKNASAQEVPPFYSYDVDLWESVSVGCPMDLTMLLDGIQTGFDAQIMSTEDSEGIDLSREDVPNLPATTEQKLRTTEWIIEQRAKGALWGPWKSRDDMPEILDGLRVSPIGTVRKGNHSNTTWEERKWRVIHHLSHPRTGFSVNSTIDDAYKFVEYVKFRTVVYMMWLLGPGAWIWTVDAKDAYMRVPIKRKCYKHMAFKWCNRFYVFTCLSFGLASACQIYTVFADWLMWIIIYNTEKSWWFIDGEPVMYHYIDDFFGGQPADREHIAIKQFNAVFFWFAKLGLPTQASKCKGPRRRLRILGFLYDTLLQMVFIPEEKLIQILGELNRISCLRRVTQLQLLQLIGKLRWASVCIYAGPAFVRRLEKAAYSVRHLHHFVEVKTLRADLRWWTEMIKRGGEGIKFEDILRDPMKGDIQVLTDASTGDGMGGWNKQGQWFRYKWTDHPNKGLFMRPEYPDIYWKEMCAIATACLIWGRQWKGKSVTFWCDNEACVWSMAKGKCSFEREDVMNLIRIICDVANKCGFRPYFIHIKGKENLTADALSRFDKIMFHRDTKGVVMDKSETPCLSALNYIIKKCF